MIGVKEFLPWTPVDSVCILKLLNFHLSWNWGQDLLREVLSKSGLEDMVEEIFPFTAEFSHNMVTIIDAEDLKNTSTWSDETLVEQYKRLSAKLPVASEKTAKAAEDEKKAKQAENERLAKQAEEDKRAKQAKQAEE